ncbi:protein S100-A6-like [Fukomys damarensis]|uniref:protein S100-A6-like n=1 Tax=Fukomys damarensis TaxID=885580 RepID=UPI0014554BB6|nr:protein S100-A6-like [Fukomys damarensis]
MSVGTGHGKPPVPFHEYSGRDCDRGTLTKKEMKELIQKELPLGLASTLAEMEAVLLDMDQNCDGIVSFQEYFTFLGTLVSIYSESLKENK